MEPRAQGEEGLYEHLAPVYDELFPLNAAGLRFLEDEARGLEGPRAADLGAGTASLAHALAERGWEVHAFEPSRGLLGIAARRPMPGGGRLRLVEGGMLDLGRLGQTGLDFVLCLGNTLPHLSREEELPTFLGLCREALRPRGRLVLQLVNFSLAGPGFEFPALVFGEGRFLRRYAEGSGGRLVFETKLELGGRNFRDRTPLLPLSPRRVEDELGRAGFSITARYSGWDRSDFSGESSPYLILLAERA